MRRLRLGPLLTGLNVGLFVIALAALAFVAVHALQQRTDALALTQVTQATTSAQSLVLQTGEGLAEKAELLALEPDLEKAVEANDPVAASTALSKFEQAMHLTSSGVLFNGHLFAQSGPALNWADLWAKHTQTSGFFFQPASVDTPFTFVAWAGIPSSPNGIVLVALPLNDSVLQSLAQPGGLPFILVTPSTTPAGDGLSALRLQAQTNGQPQAARLPNPERYVAVAPITSANGEVTVLVETELLADQNLLAVNQLIQNLLLLALGVTVVLALISYWVGGRLANPIQALAVSADRIGRGELEQPVPPAQGVEVGELSAALEEMRWRLRQLTSTLRREQAESNAIVNGIAEGVFIVDRERRIQFLNPQAAVMLGIEAKSAVGRFCGDVLNPQGVGGLRPCEEDCPIIHARFRAGARATEHLLLANGLRRSVIITSAPALQELTAGSGSGLRQIQVMRDETEEEAGRRIRDAVLANISHEFKTPLSAQLASIEMLLDQLPELEPAQIAELVISLQRGTLRLTQLIDNLLESVRIEAGRLTIRNKPIEIEDILEQALELIRPLLNQRNQETVVDLPYPLPPLTGDAPRLVQVFVNLLANANKFAPNGSIIRIGGTVTPDSLIVSVEDQGPGLPAGEAELFVPFMRSTLEEPEAQGIGLGLWIVKSIIERHGGRVTATSSAAGTKIAVRLPRTGSDESINS